MSAKLVAVLVTLLSVLALHAQPYWPIPLPKEVHHLQLDVLEQRVVSLQAQLKLEERMRAWYTTTLDLELTADDRERIENLLVQTDQLIATLYDRYNDASEQLEAYHAESKRP
jgi:hypothetical protein